MNQIIDIIKSTMQLHLNDNILVPIILSIFFIIASYTDIKHLKIYDKFNWTMLFTRITLLLVFNQYQLNHLNAYLTGGALMFITFLLVGMYGTTKMGGDIKFAGNLGLWLGFEASILLVLILILTNIIFRTIFMKKGRVALAPFFFISYLILTAIYFLA